MKMAIVALCAFASVALAGGFEVQTYDDGTLNRAAIAAQDAARESNEQAKREQIRTTINLTIYNLKNNVDHTVFSGDQRREFNELRQAVLDMAREIRRLNNIESKE